MKRFILLLALIFGFHYSMMAQKSKSKPTTPKEDIKVNREYDENGNLIKFDSLYSFNWSGDTLLLDSIYPGNFPDPFGNNFNFFSDSIDSNFMDIEDFFKQFSENKNDSTFRNSPFKNQFNFSPNSMNNMMEMLQKQMKEMEQQHQKYFNKKKEKIELWIELKLQYDYSAHTFEVEGPWHELQAPEVIAEFMCFTFPELPNTLTYNPDP